MAPYLLEDDVRIDVIVTKTGGNSTGCASDFAIV